MRKSLFLLALLAVAALAAGPSMTVRQAKDALPTADVSPAMDAPRPMPHRQFKQLDGPAFPELWNMPVTGFPDALYTVGIAVVDDATKDEFWVFSGGQGDGQAKISIYDIVNPAHPLITRFNQPLPTASWGMRDGAFNEPDNEVYAGANSGNSLVVINGTSRAMVANPTFTPGPGTLRSMEVDNTVDSAFSNNWYAPTYKYARNAPQNSHIVWSAVPRSGVANYGFALDATAAKFYLYCENFSGTYKLFRYNWPAMTVDDTFPVTSASTYGGGVDMWGSDKMLLLDQNTPDDIVRCLATGITDNVGITDVWRPAVYGEFTGAPFNPECALSNTGTNNATGVQVRCQFVSGATTYYDQTVTTNINAGVTGWLQFPIPCPALTVEGAYDVTFTLTWPPDQVPADNQLVKNGIPVNDTIEFKWDDLTDPTNPDNGIYWTVADCGNAVGWVNHWDKLDLLSVRATHYPGYPGTFRFKVYDYDNARGIPGTIIHTSSNLSAPGAAWVTYTPGTPVAIEDSVFWVRHEQVTLGLAACLSFQEPQTSPLYSQLEFYPLVPPDSWYLPSYPGDYCIRATLTRPAAANGDVSVDEIWAPTGAYDTGDIITPTALYANNGTLPATFKAFCFLMNPADARVYSESITVTALAPGDDTLHAFPDYTLGLPAGDWVCKCSTFMATDTFPDNDTLTNPFEVEIPNLDLAARAIITPVGAIDTGVAITPRAAFKNLSLFPVTGVECMFYIDSGAVNFYADTVTRDFAAGESVDVTFDEWLKPHPARTYTTKAKVFAVGDMDPANDSVNGTFMVQSAQPGWYAKSPMPTGAKGIKDGGWLTYDASKARIYASRGNKQLDFFSYDPAGDSWGARAPWLPGTEGKPPSKGSAGCADGNGVVYATKGNNKQGFYKYYANGDSWRQKADVPLGASGKKVKGGTDIVWAYKGAVGSPYLLKGYKNEFYQYDIEGDSFKTLSPAPVGGNQKWDKGSWLAYDNVGKRIYAHKAKYHEFYKYDPEGDSWSAALTPMPIPGSAGSKKSKDGGCGTFFGPDYIYALKGGGTQEFWRYTISSNSWAEKETLPKGASGKKVKAGGDITTAATVLYAFKGNKQNELWMYVPGTFLFDLPRHDGVMAGATATHQGMTISPNPLATGFAVLRYSLPKADAAVLSVYNVAGQTVMERPISGRSGIVNLDLRHLSNGVYLAKLTGDGFAGAQKLVVQR